MLKPTYLTFKVETNSNRQKISNAFLVHPGSSFNCRFQSFCTVVHAWVVFLFLRSPPSLDCKCHRCENFNTGVWLFNNVHLVAEF